MSHDNSDYYGTERDPMSALKKPDARKYVSRLVFSGKRTLDPAKVQKRIKEIQKRVSAAKGDATQSNASAETAAPPHLSHD